MTKFQNVLLNNSMKIPKGIGNVALIPRDQRSNEKIKNPAGREQVSGADDTREAGRAFCARFSLQATEPTLDRKVATCGQRSASSNFHHLQGY